MGGKYRFEPADFEKIVSYPIEERESLVDISMFSDMDKYKASGRFTDLLPSILKAGDIKDVVSAIKSANQKGAPVVLAMGAHIIKCGLSPILIDMMKMGVINALVFNGACIVHDLEIAFHGSTSENVATEIKSGRFGMVEQTSAHLNAALENLSPGKGMGEAVGEYIAGQKMPNTEHSLTAMAWKLDVPVTVHVAVGADITHVSPGVDAQALGQATFNDLKLFTGIVAKLGGGVYLNVGSAVILPEVFIKALSAARNLGSEVADFMAVNMDMIQGYRPNVNVVNRPIQDSGKGISITGHHEIMIPLLYHMLTGEGK